MTLQAQGIARQPTSPERRSASVHRTESSQARGVVSAVDAVQGALLGTAVGDSLGLPYEGMSRRRVLNTLRAEPLRHRFLFGRGMVSDDTDHACLVLETLAETTEPERFAKRLGERLRWWLAGLPAGVGWATLRGVARLWVGVSPHQSGVFSAGNGPAMRAPLIGSFPLGNEPNRRRALVRASTRLTHIDPRAEQGAQVLASAAAFTRLGESPEDVLRLVLPDAMDSQLRERLERIANDSGAPCSELCAEWGLGRGVTGFVNDTVPAALHAWARNGGQIEPALGEVIRLGGDTDTTAAIVGALCGVSGGVRSIPAHWIDGILEWPRSTGWMLQAAERAVLQVPQRRAPFAAQMLRNAAFLCAVYGLIARRALPPY